jgi:hypothetical protein
VSSSPGQTTEELKLMGADWLAETLVLTRANLANFEKRLSDLIFENMELYLALKRVAPYLEVHGWTNVMPLATDAERRLKV